MPRLFVFSLLAVFLTTASSAWADKSSTPNGAGFASSCAGLGVSLQFNEPGVSAGTASTTKTCDSEDGVPMTAPAAHSSADQSGTYSFFNTDTGMDDSRPYSASTSSDADILHIELGAHSAGGYGGHTDSSGAESNAGWNDGITLTAAGQSGQAVWILPIHVSGSMSAENLGGTAKFAVEGYRNGSSISDINAFYQLAVSQFQTLNAGLDCGAATCVGQFDDGSRVTLAGAERATFTTADQNASTGLFEAAVDELVYLAVPFNWGSAFDLGIFAATLAGSGSSGNGPIGPQNFADTDFMVAWAGPGYVRNVAGGGLDSTHITDFDIAATSGTAYSMAFSAAVPEPATLSLFGLGLAGLGGLRHRRRPRRRSSQRVAAPRVLPVGGPLPIA